MTGASTSPLFPAWLGLDVKTLPHHARGWYCSHVN